MTHARIYKYATIVLLLFILAISIQSWRSIPFFRYWGLDFHNLFVFHHCEVRNNPYLSSGAACGDVSSRDMIYPPLLYFAFIWTRWISFDLGARLWSALVLLITVGSLLAWTSREARTRAQWVLAAGFILLLGAQYPTVFAMERGNNDALVLGFWTLGYLFYSSRRLMGAGACGGTAVALKIYPSIACGVLAGGLIASAAFRESRWRDVGRMAAGVITIVVLTSALFVPQLTAYVGDELLRFAAQATPLLPYAHSLKLVSPTVPAVAWALAGTLFGVWLGAAIRAITRDPALVFAGALAISTYFSGTSYDYNLLTAYPLLLVLFLRSYPTEGGLQWVAFGLLILGLIAIIGDRGVFARSDTAMQAHILQQWAWLVGSGLYAFAKPARHQPALMPASC